MGAQGTVVLDFGAFPGKSDASVAVTGQSGIVSGSLVEAWIRLEATSDHSADEHMVETIKVFAGNIIAGTGFTVYGLNTSQLNESEPAQLFEEPSGVRTPQHSPASSEGKGTRIYGQWTIAWCWN
jgi:hypothetical protein